MSQWEKYREHVAIVVIAMFVIVLNIFFKNTSFTLSEDDASFYDIDPVIASQIISDVAKYTSFGMNIDQGGIVLGASTDGEYISKDDTVETEKSKLEREYKVEKGDTITTIANKFNMHVASIYERNKLSADNIENLKVGDTIIIPADDSSDSMEWLLALNDKKEQERQRQLAIQAAKEKERQKQLALAKRNTVTRNTTSGRSVGVNKTGNNAYPYGWCTYYAASRRNVPGGWGNAGNWLGSARSSGYATGSTPQPGAIMVTGESGYGHVAIVESVNGNSFTVSEMNYAGWGVVSSRSVSTGNPVIKGFVY